MPLVNIADKLLSNPSLRKKFEKAYFLYDEYITNLPLKFYYLQARLKNSHKKTILCYPEKPVYYHVLDQICRFSGFTITDRPQKADAVVFFEDTTYRKYDSVIQELVKKYKVINYYCWDISKEHVDEIHNQIFGYGLTINPRHYKKKYIKKGNINSLHNGVIMDQPEDPQPDFVYQLLVNNEINSELVEIRLPIIGNRIPFVYLKHRPIKDRFGSQNNWVKILKTQSVITPHEYKKILEFCDSLGLDCGEIDILRDKNTNRIYIVDANNTPAGPPYQLPLKEYKRALHMMSEAFRQAFL